MSYIIFDISKNWCSSGDKLKVKHKVSKYRHNSLKIRVKTILAVWSGLGRPSLPWFCSNARFKRTMFRVTWINATVLMVIEYRMIQFARLSKMWKNENIFFCLDLWWLAANTSQEDKFRGLSRNLSRQVPSCLHVFTEDWWFDR